MGLDVYAGTLTRYYSHNWKNQVQQIAEANGQQCTCIMRDGQGQEIKPVEDKEEIMQIRDAVCQWIGDLASAVDSIKGIDNPQPRQLWEEDNERDYFTDKPDWEAYGALVMVLAYRLQDRPMPEYTDGKWSAFDDPVVKKSISEEPFNSLLSKVTVWLPLDENCIFGTTLPTGQEVRVSSLSLLKQELDDLNRQLWKADEATIKSWRNDKYYIPVKGKGPKLLFGLLRSKKPKEKFRTEDLAQCAFSIMYEAVNFAIKQKVPLLLDY